MLAAVASAQIDRIVIPAGTPEDQAVQAINAENDTAKKAAMWQDFVGKFSANSQAVAFGNWQLSQQYQADGDLPKALESGMKAVQAQPANMDILVSVAGIAQQLKKTDEIVDLAVKGATAFNGIAKQTKPEGLSDDEFAQRIKGDQEGARQSYEYLEVSSLNAIVAEQDAKKRMGYIERFMTAFPGSRFEEQMGQMSIYTLSQLNDPSRLESFGEKLLKANPNNAGTLVLLASAFVENDSPAYLAKGEGYARKALEALKTQKLADEKKQTLYSGLAHSSLGFALVKQAKFALAIPELKAGVTELKDDPASYSTVLYRLAFAYVKSNKAVEAKAVLKDAVLVDGPYQLACKDMQTKLEAATARKK
jgi:tetratricopeptide (TPR) repeat protein